jgi:transcriptional regulator with XRE-family HTH domain
MSVAKPPSSDMQPDAPGAIEDEPYHGLFHGRKAPLLADEGRQPDRFDLAKLLKERREALGWSLDDVEDITRVKRIYLEALEQAAYDVLPPRAFALGFVKAYAKALGLDEESLADMFRREVSPQNTRLHAPSGASLEDAKPSYRRYLIVAGCLVAAIVAWNIWQHTPVSHNHRRGLYGIDASSWAAGVPLIHDGLVYVTRPSPPPPDQDVPAPYVTPGLEAQFASLDAEQNASATAPETASDAALMRKAFNPRGAIYGAEPEDSNVTLQATKSVNLVLRGADGAIYFVHQFAPGEAYRLPSDDQQDVLLDASDPSAFDLYYNGEYAGLMDAKVTPVGKVNARAAQLSNALDAQKATIAQTTTAAAPPPLVVPQATPKSDAPIPYLPAVRKAAPASAAASSSSSSSASAPEG